MAKFLFIFPEKICGVFAVDSVMVDGIPFPSQVIQTQPLSLFGHGRTISGSHDLIWKKLNERVLILFVGFD